MLSIILQIAKDQHSVVNDYRTILSGEETGWSASDYIALLSAILSIASLIIAYRTIFLSKKLEVKYNAFDKIAIQNLDKIFLPIENVISANPTLDISVKLTELNDLLGDLEIFLTGFTNIYTKDQINDMVLIKEDFGDFIFNNQTSKIVELNGEYYTFKSKLLYKAYLYAIKHKNFFKK
ncbi:MAG: hypothetical protein EOO47_19595 [Flavobacterium sp.]|nr:MAG: hypothetical protein EOO47_19595 [Flavobacterium sp.]